MVSTWSLHACPPKALPTSTPSPHWSQDGGLPHLTGEKPHRCCHPCPGCRWGSTCPPFLCLQASAIRPAGLLLSLTGTRETSARIPQPSLVLSLKVQESIINGHAFSMEAMNSVPDCEACHLQHCFQDRHPAKRSDKRGHCNGDEGGMHGDSRESGQRGEGCKGPGGEIRQERSFR